MSRVASRATRADRSLARIALEIVGPLCCTWNLRSPRILGRGRHLRQFKTLRGISTCFSSNFQNPKVTLVIFTEITHSLESE